MITDHKQPEDYVHFCYSVAQYKLAYGSIIFPVGDHNTWDVGDVECIQPPPYKRQPGRPKKARNEGLDEINNGGRVCKRGSVMSCSKCGDDTHNKASCKKPPMERPPLRCAPGSYKLFSLLYSLFFFLIAINNLLIFLQTSSVAPGDLNEGINLRGRGRVRGRGNTNVVLVKYFTINIS